MERGLRYRLLLQRAEKAGGGFTLPRLRLYECSLDAKSIDDFFENELFKYIDLQLEYMDKRVRFIVEESTFFKHSFLSAEGFIKQENFIGMSGITGPAECCSHLTGITDEKGFWLNKKAAGIGSCNIDIIEKRAAERGFLQTRCRSTGSRRNISAIICKPQKSKIT